MLELKNPHSVLAALATRARDVLEIRLGDHSPHGAWQDVVDSARSLGVPVRTGRMPGGSSKRPKSSEGAQARRNPLISTQNHAQCSHKHPTALRRP